MLVHQNVLSPQRRAGVSDLDAFVLRVEFPTPGAFQSPSAAPDGRHLAYASLEGDARSVVLLSYDAQRNEAEVRARFTHQGVAALSWRPDGSALLLQSPPVPSPHSFGPLELLELDGGRRTLSEDNVVAAWWSPDGRFVATLSPVSGGAPRTVFGATDGAELQWLAAFDAERVQQGRPPLLSLKLIDVDAGQTTPLSLLTPSPLFYGQYLPFFDQYSRSHRLWSPESDALALPILDEAGVSTVVRFGIDGSVTPLVQGDMPTWNWR
jgi:dipeptidyl aminopeptidase/acylaminoacyl peptidase